MLNVFFQDFGSGNCKPMKNNERKRLAVILNVLLLLWYALSMFGVRIGDTYLVEGAFRDEWIFLLIPTLTFILYLSLGKTGKVIHLAWLSMWFITQFLSHEWYSIFGKGFMGDAEGKIDYFKNCSWNTIWAPDSPYLRSGEALRSPRFRFPQPAARGPAISVRPCCPGPR